MLRLTLVIALLFAVALSAAQKNLDIYYVDVEGGAATLIVAPSGQSLLIDTGWNRPDARDAKRVTAAVKQARLQGIDYLMITHFHRDHVGGLAALTKLVPVGRFFDHGDRVESTGGDDATNWEAYQKVSAGKRTILKPGDKIPLSGVDVTVVASNGDVIQRAINGGGPNAALCKDAVLKKPDSSENARSAGILLGFGKFQFLDLGDLTWNKEHDLACPQNLVGKIDLLQVTHHGMDMSGAPQHILALQPQVAIINNGPRKGGTAVVYETLKKSPGLQDIWQVHRALATDAGHNTAEAQTANLEPEDECKGHYLKVSVDPNGSYTITNARNGVSKTYTAQ